MKKKMKTKRNKEGKEGVADKKRWKVGDHEAQNIPVKNKNS